MGFDNECILNIQSLPGEYFCPVCRTLIYPNEAVQSQCTHLYCKACLAYVVATTKACPYDGYLVTETDSKPLVESNKPLAETIGKVMVHCLYNKSGCQWQGTLSACITHGSTCAYGNSPVVCNRCGSQIVHRQVQEHAQLCPGVQSQTQTDGSQAQPLTGAAQAVTKDPAIVSSAGSAVAADTTVPTSITATAVTASSVATGGSASASTSAPQAATAEHWYQQQYSQYYQQYPAYNPYAQQYQQYGQYQQTYHQYTQPQMQVASQNVVQASAQPAQIMQSSQPQQMTQSQSQYQAQLQTSTGYPQTQQHQVQPQPQIQPSLPHLQVPAGQTQPQQPVQSAYQVPSMQQQSQVPLQLPAPHAQPTVHQPASSQVGPQQSYQQAQAYPQPTPQMHPHNTSYPQQMPPGAPLQQPGHASHHQGLVSQHPVPLRPPLAVLPQGIQHTPQHQQHAGYHAQRPPMHSSIPSQAPQQGLPPHSSAASQASQSYQQGVSSTQQQVHSHPLQPYGPPYAQQHVPGYGYAGQHVQTSAGRPMNPAAPPHQFKPQSSGPDNNLQTGVMNQQPAMLGTLNTGGQPTEQGSLASDSQTLQSGKSENARGVAHNSANSENRTEGSESSFMKRTMSQSLNDERMNGERNDFGRGSKDVRSGVALDSGDISIGKDGIAGWAGNSQALGLQGGKEHKASDVSNNLEKGGSVQQASQKNAGLPGAFPPQAMRPQHPFGPDRMFHQHMMNSGPMPSNMQGQPNQIRPPKHSIAENTRPPMQQPYGSLHSGMAQRTIGDNQIQSSIPHPAGIRPGDGMVRPPVVGPFPGHHDTMPPFVPDPLGRPHPPGTLKSNGVGDGPFVGKAFHEGGFNSSGEHFRSLAAHPGRHNVNHNDVEDLKRFPGPAHLEMGSNSFERTLGRHDGFPDRPAFANQKEFDHHGTDGMPNLRNPGPFVQGMSGVPGGARKDFLGPVNFPGNAQHAFDGPAFLHSRFHPGHMHPDDPNMVADYSLHGFAKEPGHFGLGGPMRNTGAGWCRICMFNCGSVENLDLHVQTREHQQFAMDLILKMKQDVAKRQKLNHGGPKSFHNRKVAGKGHFRGNKR
ncbi:hypothetical protein QOZ80_1AG0040040 [Eleusine coracana subsp. coracana]|nr:hypothetical protein QOZ80_1AG0040040 [Eleusine coracana subsp. coracana]